MDLGGGAVGWEEVAEMGYNRSRAGVARLGGRDGRVVVCGGACQHPSYPMASSGRYRYEMALDVVEAYDHREGR